mmetsp:Transcript_2579/g.4919  ORF Transcript_2579/g.4919 Transcript_2579/m.4919 type:complete len:313 (+) Transcript_2579:105-1043(+)
MHFQATDIPYRVRLLVNGYMNASHIQYELGDVCAPCITLIGLYYFELKTFDYENMIVVSSSLLFSYFRISHLVSLSFVSKSIYHALTAYYARCTTLDLSDYYGVIGNSDFNLHSFCHVFLPKFRSVQRLSLRYCSHVKTVHLDAILRALTSIVASKNSSSSSMHGNVSAAVSSANANEESYKNKKIIELDLYFCSKIGSRTLFKISARLPNLKQLNIGRCYAITAEKNVNGFKALECLPLKKLTISLDPSIEKSECTEIVALLTDEDTFTELKTLDLSYGCQVMMEVDAFSDFEEKKIKVIRPIKHHKQHNM